MFIEDDDDLFLYEEDDFDDKAIVAFGDNEIEALIILSYLFSCSLKLFCFYTQSMIYICDVWSSCNEFYFKILVVSFFFLSLFCLSVCGLDFGSRPVF